MSVSVSEGEWGELIFGHLDDFLICHNEEIEHSRIS